MSAFLTTIIAALGSLLLCAACAGQVSTEGGATLGSAEDVFALLTSPEWGASSVPRTGRLQFEFINGIGEIDAEFEFRDPLMPFEDCELRQVGDCLISECVWIAEDYADGGSMDGGAELATVEWLRLTASTGNWFQFDVYDAWPSSASRSAAYRETGEKPPGGAWWGRFEDWMREPSASVWHMYVGGGSLDGLSLSGFKLPMFPTAFMPEGDGVTHTYPPG